MNVRAIVCLSLGLVMAVAVASWADEGPPDPISLDRQSPSLWFGSTPANIYDMNGFGPMPPAPPQGWDVGGPGPILHVWEGAYLPPPQPGLSDNTDGLSNGEQMDPHQSSLSIYFSGDDMSVGLPNTDYRHQAVRSQAAGDRFMVNGISVVPPAVVMQGGGGPSWIVTPPPQLPLPGGLNNFPINLLSANQHRYNEIPSIGPAPINTWGPPDDMDALELTAINLDGDPLGIHDTPIYFSLDAASPTLGMFGATGADILVAPPGGVVTGIFAPFWSMGLTPVDEVDALAVWDTAQLGWGDPGMDFALFSLAPGSQYLFGPDGMPGTFDDLSAADIFVTDFTGVFGVPGGNTLYLQSFQLGMQFEDNIDALDVEMPWQGTIETPLDRVAGSIVPGDYNNNGWVDAADYCVWRDHLGMIGPPGIPGDGDDGSMTGNPDGWVSEADYIWWKMNFGAGAPGAGSGMLAAAVPEPTSMALAAVAMAVLGLTAARRRRP